ncbi:MAG: hypothetical protein PGN29_14820 [Gordonia paraffinivorans]
MSRTECEVVPGGTGCPAASTGSRITQSAFRWWAPYEHLAEMNMHSFATYCSTTVASGQAVDRRRRAASVTVSENGISTAGSMSRCPAMRRSASWVSTEP